MSAADVVFGVPQDECMISLFSIRFGRKRAGSSVPNSPDTLDRRGLSLATGSNVPPDTQARGTLALWDLSIVLMRFDASPVLGADAISGRYILIFYLV